MLRLRIDEIIKEQNRSKYSLYKQLQPLSYQNFNRIYKNETSGIQFSTLERIKNALGVSYDELFQEFPDNE